MKVEPTTVGAVMKPINHGECCRARTGASCHYYERKEKSHRWWRVGGNCSSPVAGSNYIVFFLFFSWAARELVEQKVTRTKDPTKQAHPPPAPQSQHNPPQHLFAVCSVIYLCVFTRPPVLYTLCRPYGVHLCNSVDE